MPDKENNEIKLLEARIGNLEVQVSEYRYIVQELTEKLQSYEKRMGSVFVKGNDKDNN